MSPEGNQGPAESKQRAKGQGESAIRLKKFSEFITVTAGAFSVLGLFLAASVAFFQKQEMNKAGVGVRAIELERELKAMEASLAEAQRQLQLNAELVKRIEDAKPAGPANVEVARLATQVDGLRAEVKQLTDAVGQSPEKALAVPLLRKDMDNLREGYRHDLDATQSEMNRVYDLTKWFLGTVVTMALALLGLAVSNFLQLRRG